MNLSGAAAKPLAGENDLAQNPFDLEAEYGPSLFDARHRFVASAQLGSRTSPTSAPPAVRALFDDWQMNAIAALQLGHAVHRVGLGQRRAAGQQPADLRASRPAARTWSAIRTAGRTPSTQWLSRDAFQRLNVADPGRAVRQRRPQHRARARRTPTSTCRSCATSPLPGDVRLQFRAEVFNVLNHANFGLPVADLNSPNFGRIFSRRPAAPDAVRAEADRSRRS